MSIGTTSIPLTLEQLPEISARAQTYYRHNDPLEYHHYPHVGDTQGYFRVLADALEVEGVEIDRPLGFATLEFHDAGYHLDHEKLEFDSKEAFSAAIAEVELSDMGIDVSEIELVKSGIMSTHIAGRPIYNTEKAVRLADVGNAADGPLPFQLNLIRFAHDEIQMGRELPATFYDFCQRSKKFLGLYYQPTEFVRPDGSTVVLHDVYAAAKKNLDSLDHLDVRQVLKFTGMDLRPELEHWLK